MAMRRGRGRRKLHLERKIYSSHQSERKLCKGKLLLHVEVPAVGRLKFGRSKPCESYPTFKMWIMRPQWAMDGRPQSQNLNFLSTVKVLYLRY
jgi:hypothetical protein